MEWAKNTLGLPGEKRYDPAHKFPASWIEASWICGLTGRPPKGGLSGLPKDAGDLKYAYFVALNEKGPSKNTPQDTSTNSTKQRDDINATQEHDDTRETSSSEDESDEEKTATSTETKRQKGSEGKA